jgi:4-amino-4-deoxy-L-arabinose transferase-like glycosyltransferase
MKSINIQTKNIFLFLLILILGILVRIYFSTGHVFSDDAYYSYLSYTILNGEFTAEYLGYPIFPLRIFHLLITAFLFKLFGINEFATILFPFIISIANLFLIYKLTKVITDNEKTALLSSLLIAFFPTDIIFASINFVDSTNVFFINLGIYFLYKSYNNNKNILAVSAGLCFFFSMQFKENIYYTGILLIILWLYLLIKNKTINTQIIIALIFIVFNVILEGVIYLFLHQDFLRRFSLLSQNYNYSYYDFFPYTAEKFSGLKNYWRNLFDQIFLINGKAIFLRRFYLFLPIVASIKSIINITKKEYILLTYWFLGTLVLLIAFTTSFSEYKPLDLKRSWYIYPLLAPTIILSAIAINQLKKYLKYLLIGIYIIGAIIMSTHYEVYFNKKDISNLKTFLNEHPEKKIFSGHFTKYSVDLLRNYHDLTKSERLLGNEFDWETVRSGEWVLFNQKHIDELKLQRYDLPSFSILQSVLFNKIEHFGDFITYERTH